MSNAPPIDASTGLRRRNVFAPEVNGHWLGLIAVQDRDPWDHDLSAGGMDIWLRFLGSADDNDCSRERYDLNDYRDSRDSRDSLGHKAVKDRVIRRPMNPDTVAEQQDRCYQLRLAGMPLRGIAARTGLALGTVHKRLRAAMAERQQGTTP